MLKLYFENSTFGVIMSWSSNYFTCVRRVESEIWRVGLGRVESSHRKWTRGLLWPVGMNFYLDSSPSMHWHTNAILVSWDLVVWRSVSALASINEVNLRQARLVLRWATMSGFNSRCRTLISVYNQPATEGQLSLPSIRSRKWVPASAGKAKAGIVHSVSGCVQVKLCEIPWERVPYLSALEVWSRQGAIQIYVTFTFT